MASSLLQGACRACTPRGAFQPANKLHSRSSQLLRPVQAGKGFGTPTEPKKQESEAGPSSSDSKQSYAMEALEERMRNRRARRAEAQAQVKVESAVVEAVSGKQPLTQQQQAEGNYVMAMTALFGLIMLQGLLIAGSGFLPEDWDAFIEDVLYPNFTPLLGLFLALSTAYGLWKVGKLPLPFLGAPPPQDNQD